MLLVVFFIVRRRRRERVKGGISVANPTRDLTPERPPSPGADVLRKIEEDDKLRYTSAPPLKEQEEPPGTDYQSLSAHRMKYDYVVDN